MFNNDELRNGEYLKAKLFRYNQVTQLYEKNFSEFHYKQLIKSGRGRARGFDNVSNSPIPGMITSKIRMSIITTSPIDFNIHDKVNLIGLGEDGEDLKLQISDVSFVVSGSNKLKFQQFKPDKSKLSKTIELV